MLEYYGRRAREYERVYHKPERQQDLIRLRNEIPRLFTGADLLEIACGTGYWTEILAPAARSILATDHSSEVLEIARTKSYPGSRVRFAVADAFRLGTVGQGFTAGFAGFWWSHVPREELAAFLRGFHASLAPGARVLFVDNRYVEGSNTPISRRDETGNTYQLRSLEDGSTHEVLKNFPTVRELRASVANSADEVEVTELPYYWCLSYRLRSPGNEPPADPHGGG
jgi:SAM-dependent methyltransferase